MLRSQITRSSKILSRAMQFTSDMKPEEKLASFISTRSSRDKVIFDPLLSKNELFDFIKLISIQKQFSKVVQATTGINVHSINGVNWFESAVNKRELAIAIGAGSTTYSKGKTGFSFFKNKELKYRELLKTEQLKSKDDTKYCITSKEVMVLNKLNHKPEHIKRMKEGFKTHHEIVMFSNELTLSGCNFNWSPPTKRTTVSKRLNGCNGQPIQPKLPLICVIGLITPKQAYSFNLAERPAHSTLCSTKGLSNKLTAWENDNHKLNAKERRGIYSRFQAENHAQLSSIAFSNKLKSILLGVDTRKSPVVGFTSKDAMQNNLGINPHQVEKVLKGCDKNQALIDNRKKPFFIASQSYTLTEVAKKTGLTLMAAYQRVKKHKGKANEFELIFAPKYQKGNTDYQGSKSVLKSSESFYVVDYKHPNIDDELIKFGVTSKATTDERLSDHAKSRWSDLVMINGPSKLIRQLERLVIAHRKCMNLTQPVVNYTQVTSIRPVSGYQDILLKDEFMMHFQMLISAPEQYCYKLLYDFARKEKLNLNKISVIYKNIDLPKAS